MRNKVKQTNEKPINKTKKLPPSRFSRFKFLPSMPFPLPPPILTGAWGWGIMVSPQQFLSAAPASSHFLPAPACFLFMGCSPSGRICSSTGGSPRAALPARNLLRCGLSAGHSSFRKYPHATVSHALLSPPCSLCSFFALS